MTIEDGKVFTNTPTLVVVREELSKARHQYLTFLCQERCEIVKDHLERRGRKRRGRASTDRRIRAYSHLVRAARKRSNFGVKDASPFIRTTKVGDEMRKAMSMPIL
jgi:hypothetical protein